MARPSVDEFTIGWMCALQEEYDAACRMLDEEFEGLDTAEQNDHNTYVFGRIIEHKIIIGCFEADRYGIGTASDFARNMVRSFPKIRFALMVGTGGGAPTMERDIRLGDVVVSEPQGKLGGVYQYDLGKRLDNGSFQEKGQHNAPPTVLLRALPEMRRHHRDPKKPDRIAEHLKLMDDMPEFARPLVDDLFRTEYKHQQGNGCDNCDRSGLVQRPSRSRTRAITVHYGTIASANSLMKSATDRDRYANDPELNILCFEMEAAGLMNNFPTLVIRGICDYSDSHKNDEWHRFAALAAAAYARELLHVVKPERVAGQPTWGNIFLEKIKYVEEEVSKITQHQRSQKDMETLQWLTPFDHVKLQVDKAKIQNTYPRAGQWFLESTKFHEWLGTTGQTLFCPGIPGAGKTTLTSIVVEYLLSKQMNQCRDPSQEVGVAFIYCDYKQSQEPQEFVASILKQLAYHHSEILHRVQKLQEQCALSSRRPFFIEIMETLRSGLTDLSVLYIVADAMDECDQLCRKRLVSEIGQLQNDYPVNFMATSRYIPEIESEFRKAQIMEIKARDEDVQAYVESCMEILPGFIMKSPDLQRETKDSITKAVDGMFLLAKLYVGSLVGSRSVKAFRHTLESLPTGSEAYDHAYDDAMSRITNQVPSKSQLAIQALCWVVCAREHLSPTSLQHALAVEAGCERLDFSNIPDFEDVLSVCLGLIVFDQERNIVRLVHYTTQQYFDRRQKDKLPNAQAYIATTCATYLSFKEVLFDDLSYTQYRFGELTTEKPVDVLLAVQASLGTGTHKMPGLFCYIALNWGHHAREARVITEAVNSFLSSNSKIQASSILILHLNERDSISQWYHLAEFDQKPLPQQPIPTGQNGLHLAAYFGIEAVFKNVPELETLNARDNFGRTSLWWASAMGRTEVVRLILKISGNNVNARDKFHQTPLQVALERGHMEAANLLLGDSRTDPKVIGHQELTRLIRVVERHRFDALVTLFTRIDVRLTRRLKGSPSTQGDIPCTESTPLYLAAECGREDLVALCLKGKMGDPNAKDSRGNTALSKAVAEGHESVVKLLIGNVEVDVNSEDAKGRTPLFWAIRSVLVDHDTSSTKGLVYHVIEIGKKSARTTIELMLLLDSGRVNVNSQDFEGRTALLWAAANGDIESAKFLLWNGKADINSRDNSGGTLLFWSAIRAWDLANSLYQRTKHLSSYTGRAAKERVLIKSLEESTSRKDLFAELQSLMKVQDQEISTCPFDTTHLPKSNDFRSFTAARAEISAALSVGTTEISSTGLQWNLDRMSSWIDLLVSSGADLDSKHESGWTPRLILGKE